MKKLILFAIAALTLAPVALGETSPVFRADGLRAPSEDKYETWQFLSNYDGAKVTVAFDSDEVYVRDLFPGIDGCMVTGKVEGGKVVFESDQYVGMIDGYSIYFIAAHGVVRPGEIFPYWTKRDKIEFDYDPASRTMSPPQGYAILGNLGKRKDVSYYSGYEFMDPVLKPWDPTFKPSSPKAPVFVGMQAYNAERERGYIYFYLPAVDVNNNMLQKKRLYYNLCIDDEVYELMTDEYTGLEADCTDIPWLLTDSNNELYGYSTYRFLAFHVEGFESIGIRSFYLDKSGERLYSEMMKVDADGNPATARPLSGNGSEATGTRHYNLQGQRVKSPSRGSVTVTRTVCADGSVRIQKTVR